MLKYMRYRLESVSIFLLFALFKILPLSWASDLGGFLGRMIGPRLAVSRKALRHLKLGLPDLSEAQRCDAMVQMWDNLGRVMAEYPHLETLAARSEVIGAEAVQEIIAGGRGAIFVSGHFGNWEILGPALYKQFGIAPILTYRAPNNPYVDGLLNRARTLGGQLTSYPKERESGRRLLQALKQGQVAGFLMDQKYNEGAEVNFLGHPAMTNPVAVQMAQKLNVPIVLVHSERLESGALRIYVEEPVRVFKDQTLEDAIKDIHIHFENWVRKNPGQWLWLHKRWRS